MLEMADTKYGNVEALPATQHFWLTWKSRQQGQAQETYTGGADIHTTDRE